MIPSLSLGQFGRRVLGEGGSVPTDVFWGNVATYVQFDDANGDTTPVCLKGKSWTGMGNAQVSTSSPLVGAGSGLLDGTDDFFDCQDNINDFNLGSGDFCFDLVFSIGALLGSGGVYMLIGRYYTAIAGNKSYEIALYNNSGTYQIVVFGSSDGNSDDGSWSFNLGFTPSTNTPYFFRLNRNGGSLYAWMCNLSSTTTATQIGSTQAISFTFFNSGGSSLTLGAVVGGSSIPQFELNGKVDEFRMTVGQSRETTSFVADMPWPSA